MRKITADALMSVEAYTKVRKERRAALVQRKKQRRLEVGPYCTLHFENYDSMWFQVQEMLYIEKGGPEQIPGELAAYNPLIPNGTELVATVLFEIDDPAVQLAECGLQVQFLPVVFHLLAVLGPNLPLDNEPLVHRELGQLLDSPRP